MEQSTLNRGQFIKQIGLSSKALLAFYCIGAVSACSKEDTTTPAPPVNTTPPVKDTGLTGTADGATINFSLNLKNDNYKKLTTDGEFVIAGDVLVANVGGKYVAVAKKCTHAGTELAYRKAQGDFWCSNHNSEFNLDGSVKKAPAAKSITLYKAEFDTMTSILKVS
jgi:cytochrome b6-f complex iron-sulfur subunit